MEEILCRGGTSRALCTPTKWEEDAAPYCRYANKKERLSTEAKGKSRMTRPASTFHVTDSNKPHHWLSRWENEQMIGKGEDMASIS